MNKPIVMTLLLPLCVVFAQTPAPKPAAAAPAKPAVAGAKPAAAPAKPATGVAKPKPAAPAKPAEPAILTVGTEKFTKTQFEQMLAGLPDRVRAQYSTEAGKRQFAQQLGEVIALGQEARRLNLDKDPKTIAQIRLQTDQVLAQSMMQQASEKMPVDDAALRKMFEENSAQYQQVVARHILIRFKGSPVPVRTGEKDQSEEESLAKLQAIKKRIQGGEDFAEVAKKESDDVGSGSAGGSLGAFGRGQMVKAFEDAAFALPVGQLSDAVKSQFGYHLIQVQEIKGKTFEEVKPLLIQRSKPERAKQIVEEVKKKTPIVLDEAFFGKAK